jgi:hypothetical protein
VISTDLEVHRTCTSGRFRLGCNRLIVGGQDANFNRPGGVEVYVALRVGDGNRRNERHLCSRESGLRRKQKHEWPLAPAGR